MSQEQPRRPQSDTLQEEEQPRQADHKNAKSKKVLDSDVSSPLKKLTCTAPSSDYHHQGRASGITIGEALEATAVTAGDKPVEWSDAAAIQAAEVRATGRTTIIAGGLAAAAQSAATMNARIANDESKTKLADILSDATSKLPTDKPATRRDAEGVVGAELRNDPNLTTHPGGVAASIVAAARLNQQNQAASQKKESPKKA
uniref:SMP domain-containing protein n=1 Tax=Kalanchoe fedtschenkoi TaxID=63787 RepID=A0A7N0TJJ1_KALFE